MAKQLAAQHSQRLEHTLANVPGLRIATPGTPQDSCWQLSQAIAAADPIIVLEHEFLYFTKGPFDAVAAPPPMHAVAIRRPCSEVTLIAWHRMVPVAMEAAMELAENGVQAEGGRPAQPAADRLAALARVSGAHASRDRGGRGLPLRGYWRRNRGERE